MNVGDLLPAGTIVSTGERSAALLSLPGRHSLRLGPRTTIVLRTVGQNRAFSFNVLSGHMWSLVHGASRPTRYEVQTPSAIVGVAGTMFDVLYEPSSRATRVSTAEGVVNVRQGGRFFRVTRGKLLRFRREVRNGSVVQVTEVIEQTHEVRRMWKVLRGDKSWLEMGGNGVNSEQLRQLENMLDKEMKEMMDAMQKKPRR